MMVGRLGRQLWVLALATLWLAQASGCADGPGDRYLKAVEAAARVRDAPKDEKAKAVDDMLHYFTANSADVLRGVWQVKKRASRYAWTRLDKLLVPGNVLETKEDGDMRILTVENERGKTFDVRMVNEGGLWVIDGLSLKRFWSRLRATEL